MRVRVGQLPYKRELLTLTKVSPVTIGEWIGTPTSRRGGGAGTRRGPMIPTPPGRSQGRRRRGGPPGCSKRGGGARSSTTRVQQELQSQRGPCTDRNALRNETCLGGPPERITLGQRITKSCRFSCGVRLLVPREVGSCVGARERSSVRCLAGGA